LCFPVRQPQPALVGYVIGSALRAKGSCTSPVILFCLSGEGLMDMGAFS